jgi:hypothetical protein
MTEHAPQMPTSEALPVIIEGQTLEQGTEYQLFCNGEHYIGVIAEATSDEENHTITVVLDELTSPAVYKNHQGTFIFDTLRKTWQSK